MCLKVGHVFSKHFTVYSVSMFKQTSRQSKEYICNATQTVNPKNVVTWDGMNLAFGPFLINLAVKSGTTPEVMLTIVNIYRLTFQLYTSQGVEIVDWWIQMRVTTLKRGTEMLDMCVTTSNMQNRFTTCRWEGVFYLYDTCNWHISVALFPYFMTEWHV